MLCNNCGRNTLNEEANFCDYCGHQLQEHIQEAVKQEKPVAEPVNLEPVHKPISLLNWLASYGVLLIPIVGIVMIFLWSFGKNISPSKKNWARATLIFAIVMLLYMMSVMNAMGMGSLLQDYANGNITLTEFINSLYSTP